MTTKQTAAHVLATGHAEGNEAQSLAASVLAQPGQIRTDKSKDELQALLSRIEGREGQAERVSEIKRMLEA